MPDNTYLPKLARIVDIKTEVGGRRAIKTFRVEFLDGDGFSHRCGQCAMVSVLGKGEAMFSISSSPLLEEYLHFSVLRTGRVTVALHDMEVGDVIGLRGAYGNGFPIEAWEGKNLVFIGGGCGLAPIWSVLQTALARKRDYGDITLFHGARTPGDIVYKDELGELRERMAVHLSVDAGEPGWEEFVGFVPANLIDKKPSSLNAIGVVCGPPIMIRSVIDNLESLGFAGERIFTTVENKMKCGIGKCGRCNIGGSYACKDGPVYSWAELKNLPKEY